MTMAHFIVCERNDRWTVALGWALQRDSHNPIRVKESHSLGTVWECLREAPASLVAICLNDVQPAELVNRLAALPYHYPQARVVILGEKLSGDVTWKLRALGVVHIVTSIRRIDEVVSVLQRHFDLQGDRTAPWREAIWNRIPWQCHARFGVTDRSSQPRSHSQIKSTDQQP